MPRFGEARKFYIVFASDGVTVAGAIRYFGVGQTIQALEARLQHRVPFRCRIRNMRAYSSVAPGAGESFTFTFRRNGAATLLTCTMAGAGVTTAEDLINYVECAADDLICMEINASALAAVGYVNVVVEVDY